MMHFTILIRHISWHYQSMILIHESIHDIASGYRSTITLQHISSRYQFSISVRVILPRYLAFTISAYPPFIPSPVTGGRGELNGTWYHDRAAIQQIENRCDFL